MQDTKVLQAMTDIAYQAGEHHAASETLLIEAEKALDKGKTALFYSEQVRDIQELQIAGVRRLNDSLRKQCNDALTELHRSDAELRLLQHQVRLLLRGSDQDTEQAGAALNEMLDLMDSIAKKSRGFAAKETG